MKLTIYKYPEGKQDFIWIIDIKERYTEMWYNEIMRRFIQADWERFDVDESFELWQISINHLKHMMEFLSDNI